MDDAGDLLGNCETRPQITLGVTRGAWRLLGALGVAVAPEVCLPNGRRADLMGLGPKGQIVIVEVKSGPEDFKADLKWREYQPYCDQFYFAVAPEFPQDILPAADDHARVGARVEVRRQQAHPRAAGALHVDEDRLGEQCLYVAANEVEATVGFGEMWHDHFPMFDDGRPHHEWFAEAVEAIDDLMQEQFVVVTYKTSTGTASPDDAIRQFEVDADIKRIRSFLGTYNRDRR